MDSSYYQIHPNIDIGCNDEQTKVLLNILEVGSQKMGILASYKAQRKCFKIAKKTRINDYKEYVERMQLEFYPREFKKTELGRRIVMLLCGLPFSLGGTCVFLVLGACGAFASKYDSKWCVPLFMFFLVVLVIHIWIILKNSKEIKAI